MFQRLALKFQLSGYGYGDRHMFSLPVAFGLLIQACQSEAGQISREKLTTGPRKLARHSGKGEDQFSVFKMREKELLGRK